MNPHESYLTSTSIQRRAQNRRDFSASKRAGTRGKSGGRMGTWARIWACAGMLRAAISGDEPATTAELTRAAKAGRGAS